MLIPNTSLLPLAGLGRVCPAGRFLFCENMDGDTHQLLALGPSADGRQLDSQVLRQLPAIPFGQRYHAHPFLSPDRRWLVYTELVDGFSQVCALNVQDIVDQPEYQLG